jgi:hypothetical protein
MRWLWLGRTDEHRAWSGLDLQATKAEEGFFFASTTMSIGNGLKAKFWEDRWIAGKSVREIAPMLYACIPKRRRRCRTVADGLAANKWARDIRGVLGIHEVGQYLQLWARIEGTVLSTEEDRLIWKWSASGVYSARSAYLASFHGSASSQAWKMIWRPWAPPRVKFFHWLADLDRCWTAARLERHGLPHHPRCLLCDQAPETMLHLVLECPFSRQVWHEVLSWLRMTCSPPAYEASLHEWWITARQNTPAMLRKGLDSATLLVPWMIWKHRNACVFERARPSTSALLAHIKDEAQAWAMAGARGLRVALPTTWDVH